MIIIKRWLKMIEGLLQEIINFIIIIIKRRLLFRANSATPPEVTWIV